MNQHPYTVVHTQCNGRLLVEGAVLLFLSLLPQGELGQLADLTDFTLVI